MIVHVPSSSCLASSLPAFMPLVLFLFMKIPKSTGRPALLAMQTSTALGWSVVAHINVCTRRRLDEASPIIVRDTCGEDVGHAEEPSSVGAHIKDPTPCFLGCKTAIV
jgi:hypothetical protein